MLYKRPAKDVKCYRKISLVMIFIEITNQGSLIVKIYNINIYFNLIVLYIILRVRLKCLDRALSINPFVTSQNHGCVLKQCKFFREVANIMYTLMMHKHNNMIIWMVKDYIILARLTHLTNFNQYSVFATSQKKGTLC